MERAPRASRGKTEARGLSVPLTDELKAGSPALGVRDDMNAAIGGL
jgi:hypothetical protein